MTEFARTRVAVVVSHLTIGGAEQLLLELLRHLDRQRLEIQIIFLRDPGILGKEILGLGFPVITRVIRAKFDPRGIFRLARLFRDSRTEVILLINHLNTLFYAVLAAQLAGIRRCVNWENETYKRYPCHRLTMLGRRVLHRGVDWVVAAALGHADYIASEEGIPRRKIRAIYNGVDPKRFESNLTSGEAKTRLGIPPGSAVVSIVAALRPDKAHHVFLKAARRIVDALSDTHFLVIGDGPQRSFLEGLAAELKLGDHVHFLGFQRELGDILAAVDVNCLSSYPQQETLSVAALEAMSTGIPMVCTDVGFMREIVIPGETGFLVPVDDPQALADSLLLLLKNPEQRLQMGGKARRMVLDRLSIEGMARAFEELITGDSPRQERNERP